MNKQEQIAAKLAEPIKVGDTVSINIPYIKIVTTYKGKKSIQTEMPHTVVDTGIVKKVIDNDIHGICYMVDTYSTSVPSEVALPYEDFKLTITDNYHLYKAEWVKQSTSYCGANPLKSRLRITFNSCPINSLLSKGRFGRRNDNYLAPDYKVMNKTEHEHEKKLIGRTYGGINFNPYVLNAKDEKIYYQRELVWGLEQKQLLIHSIYNGIEIGKFILKHHSWAEIEKQMMQTGHGFDFDCVDGKQRFHAILDFVQNKFPDEFGNYFDDLSSNAQRHFMNYDNLALGELEDKASYEDILKTFLTLNFMGTPMSKEHIEYVQSINLK